MSPILLLVIGLALLLGGGEVLVKGAVSIAKRMHISPMVVGLTVVSFGTSAPELLVSLQAALEGHADIAVGNVIGSNIANLALVLGCTALVLPIPVARNTIRVDWPAMMIATQTSRASLLRSTALILVTTAVTASTSRCMIIGRANALDANVTAAKKPLTATVTAI